MVCPMNGSNKKEQLRSGLIHRLEYFLMWAERIIVTSVFLCGFGGLYRIVGVEPVSNSARGSNDEDLVG